MADPKNPPSFKDALVDASQAIAGGVGSADYDSKFAGMLLEVIGKFIQPGGKHEQNNPQQPGAGGAPQPPAPGGDSSSTPAPPGVGSPAQPGGGAGVPAGGGAQTPPGAPTPGGMTQGLTPNPDEMRRVLADVAGK